MRRLADVSRVNRRLWHMRKAPPGYDLPTKHFNRSKPRCCPTTAKPPTRAIVQAHRLSFVLALHEQVPRVMDHHSSGCLPAEKFPTFGSGRQGRGATTLSDFRRQFRLTRSRDVAQEESPAYGDGSAL